MAELIGDKHMTAPGRITLTIVACLALLGAGSCSGEVIMGNDRLFERGHSRVYRGAHLQAISLPIGGIGAGCIQVDGRAVRSVWQIFGNHAHAFVPDSFFAVRVKADSQDPLVRALQTEPVGPFLPMRALSFRGEYPFGWYDFGDPSLPVNVSLETFNPLVPTNCKDSAIPCAVFNITVENMSARTLGVSLLAAQQNAVGFTGEGEIVGRVHPSYGQNKNRIMREGGATILHMSTLKPEDTVGFGDMALMVTGANASATADCPDLPHLFSDYLADGLLDGPESAGPSPAGETIDGALAVPFRLKPGQRRTVTFVLTWYFPNVRHGMGEWGGTGYRYCRWWTSALDVARDLRKRLDSLASDTRLYHDALYSSTLPRWILDRLSSQVAILRTQTCFWTKDGYFGGWEGCSSKTGCCMGNCSHVWHYAQAHARLFPEIARLMREQEFRAQSEDGGIPYRQGAGAESAFDGQCGTILGAYREHLMSPDNEWLKSHWPSIQKAMEFLIRGWDADEDGVLAGRQWNTLDDALGGSTTWMGSLYLASLAACEEMAMLQGDRVAAERYRRIRLSGAVKQDETLFNGDYYIQIPDPQPRRDYLTGCHIDQLLGEWWARQLGLGGFYPRDHVRSALSALFRYNFHPSFRGITQSPRKFVSDDDAGMQMITWPRGGRPSPEHCIYYADEVMTGFEYAAAATMIQAGMLGEGFTVLRAVYDRYDGRLRTDLSAGDNASWGYSGNPFGDDECGKFYARAMSVWSVLLACQGFIYDGPAGRIGFAPVWEPENHVSFFTASEGWGVFSQERKAQTQTCQVKLLYGKLRIREIVLGLSDRTRPSSVRVTIGDTTLDCTHELADSTLTVRFTVPVTLKPDDFISVVIR